MQTALFWDISDSVGEDIERFKPCIEENKIFLFFFFLFYFM